MKLKIPYEKGTTEIKSEEEFMKKMKEFDEKVKPYREAIEEVIKFINKEKDEMTKELAVTVVLTNIVFNCEVRSEIIISQLEVLKMKKIMKIDEFVDGMNEGNETKDNIKSYVG